MREEPTTERSARPASDGPDPVQPLDPVAALVARLGPAFELAPVFVAFMAVPEGTMLWANSVARRMTGGRDYSEGRAARDESLRAIEAARWERFCSDHEPYSTVLAVEVRGVESLVRSRHWPVRDDSGVVRFAVSVVEPASAVDLAKAEQWIEAWPQPAIAVHDDRVDLNPAFLDALGHDHCTIDRTDRARLGGEVRAHLASATRPATGPVRLELRDRRGELAAFLLTEMPSDDRWRPHGQVWAGFAVGPTDPVSPEGRAIDLPSALSKREREVVTLMLDGYRVPQIAARLYLSPNTVRNHLRSIFRKTGTHSQAKLIDAIRGHVELPTR
jgi:DNA-binding CsgD family transcriptional regulator